LSGVAKSASAQNREEKRKKGRKKRGPISVGCWLHIEKKEGGRRGDFAAGSHP